MNQTWKSLLEKMRKFVCYLDDKEVDNRQKTATLLSSQVKVNPNLIIEHLENFGFNLVDKKINNGSFTAVLDKLFILSVDSSYGKINIGLSEIYV